MSDHACCQPPLSPVYGPVPSWRFGRSLGIDPILQSSICSFNCIYCQLGNIQVHTAEQRIYVPTEQIAAALDAVDWSAVDVVTVSGSGEPTLALNLDGIIAAIKARTTKPLMVLTNATMLNDDATRRRLFGADKVACKLDAVSDEQLFRVNRPVEGVTLAGILSGIRALRESDFPGQLAIQCMLMPGGLDAVPELARLLSELHPDEVHLNTPRRPYPRGWYPESRGNHQGPAPVAEVHLKTITLEQAQQAEQILRAALPGTPILSVYQDAPEP